MSGELLVLDTAGQPRGVLLRRLPQLIGEAGITVVVALVDPAAIDGDVVDQVCRRLRRTEAAFLSIELSSAACDKTAAAQDQIVFLSTAAHLLQFVHKGQRVGLVCLSGSARESARRQDLEQYVATQGVSTRTLSAVEASARISCAC